jgi:site-specific recombinase XerD
VAPRVVANVLLRILGKLRSSSGRVSGMAQPPPFNALTIEQAVDAFLDVLAMRGNISLRTVSTTKADLVELLRLLPRIHVNPGTPLDDLTADQIDQLVSTHFTEPDRRRKDTAKTERSPDFTLRFRNSLTQLFRTADRKNWVHADPMPDADYRPPKTSKPMSARRKAISKKAAGDLIAAAGNRKATGFGPAANAVRLRDRLIMHILVESGPRVSELCAFNLDDVRTNEAVIDGVPVIHHLLEIVRGKGNKTRSLPVTEKTWGAYQAYLEHERPTLRAALSPNAVPDVARDSDTALFLSVRGRRLTPRAIQQRLQDLRPLAKVDVTPHGLRHTAATLLLDGENGTLPAVRAVLGHADISTTGRYIDTDEAAAIAAVDSHPVTHSSDKR